MHRIKIVFLVVSVIFIGYLSNGCSTGDQAITSSDDNFIASNVNKVSSHGLERAMEVQKEHNKGIFSRQGVVGTGVSLTNDDQPLIVIFIKNENARPGLPSTLSGFPVHVTVSGEFRALKGPPNTQITQQPQDQTVEEGQIATFTVVAEGAKLSYQWRRDGSNISGESGTFYSTDPVTLADDGAVFDVVVSGKRGTVTSETAVLNVNSSVPTPPSIVTEPQDQIVEEGLTATFTVSASGTAPLTYQWRRDGIDIAGSNNASYTTNPTVLADDGAVLYVVVTNYLGSATSTTALLTVTEELQDPFDETDHTSIQPIPIKLGTSGGWKQDLANGYCCGGTLGALITDGSSQYILSNFHVFQADTDPGDNGVIAQAGDNIIQPGLIDVSCNFNYTQGVATLSTFSFPASLPTYNIDASVAEVIPGMVNPDGEILEIGAISSQTVAAYVNQRVKKSGRTTGLTFSKVYALNASITVIYDSECAGAESFTKTFTGQIVITNKNKGRKFLDSGDSGSLLAEDKDNNPAAIGLLFAGSSRYSIANPIDDVLNHFSDMSGTTFQMVGN